MSASLPNHYASLLKLYSEARNSSAGIAAVKKLHCFITKILLPDTFLSNTLITAYSNAGLLPYACRVFDTIPFRNAVSWNAMLSAYSKSHRVQEMEETFRLVPKRDCVSWNSLISGYAAANQGIRAVGAYKLMLTDGSNLRPDRITMSNMLVLSSGGLGLGLGKQMHCQIVKSGFGSYVFVGSPLVDMYSRVGLIEDAKLVFDGIAMKNVVLYNTMITGFLRCGLVDCAKKLFGVMPQKDSISWTTLLSGLTQNGNSEEAIKLVKDMRKEGVTFDQFTFGSALKACGSVSSIMQGKEIHACVLRTCYVENIFVGSALVDMYCKCGKIRYAEPVFRQMKVKNVISWTALLVGYGQNEYYEEAVMLFREMQSTGVEPDDFTLGSVISSCAHLAILEEGMQFHCQALSSGLMSFITVSNALVTLYSKCGNTEEAHRLFDEMEVKDQVSWTALVSGYGQFGKGQETIQLFERMLTEGLKPDSVTFIGVLSACSRAGLVDKGRHYFDSMFKIHRITPTTDHYTCMIDLYGRAGKLEEAKNLILRMPCKPDAVGWATLLSSCRVHGNVEIGNWAAESLQGLEPHNPAGYVLLAGLYAAKKNWDLVSQMRRQMRDRGVKKEPGCSWIRYKNKYHIFSADDHSHSCSSLIYNELEKLYPKLLEAGYRPQLSSDLHDVVDDEKLQLLSHHSERLAIVFGIIYVPSPLPIRVVKNLRVCVDCHNVAKYISKVVGRDILVRDAVRFHLFKDGACSCGDFW